MIDTHTHVLPGIDDGSRDIHMTEELLRRQKEMGVAVVCATPHFYAHRRSVDQFLERREGAIREVEELYIQDGGEGRTENGAVLKGTEHFPELRFGAEVAYFSGMGRAEQLKELCYQGTGTLLLEMPFEPWTEYVLQDVEDILRRQRLTVVLAHVERYISLQRNKKVFEQVLGLPVTVQVNAGSLIAGGHRRRAAVKLLKNAERSLLGSDCHNLDSRIPNLKVGYEVAEKKVGRGYGEVAERLGKELLGVTGHV